MRNQIIESLYSINGVLYTAATEVQKDAWLVDNADRVLFGAAVGNNSGNDHSASLANIDNTAAKLTTNVISLAKRRAQLASPAIKPIRLNEDEEWYVMFANSLSFRDLSKDPAMVQANREARAREGNSMNSNPLFTGGSLVWDGVIIREIPEIPVLAGVGAGGIDVGANFSAARKRSASAGRSARSRRRTCATTASALVRRRAGNPRHREAAVRQLPTTRPTSCNTAWSRCTPLPSRTHNAVRCAIGEAARPP